MVVVGTWNVENLFSAGEFAPTSEAVYRAKLEGIAATIVAGGLDVVGLQEVGDPTAFADLLTRLGPDWRGALSGFPDVRGIRVAVVSRLPLVGSATGDTVDFPAELGPVPADAGTIVTRMGRGALRVRVRAAIGVVDVVSCHLKSKLITYPGGRFQPTDESQRARFAAYALHRRAAEAVTVRGLADRLLAGRGRQRRLIVLGDFNDAPEAATTQILHGPAGSELGTAGAFRPDSGDGHRLVNLAPLLPEGQRASRIYRGRGELIDHLFVSRALLGSVEAVSTIAPGPLPSITEDPAARRNAPVSDHAMVTAQLSETDL